MIVVDILLGLLLVVAVLLGVLVLMPIHFRAVGELSDDAAAGHARLAWAFGLVAAHARPEGLVLRVAGVPVLRRTYAQLLRSDPDKREARRKKRADKAARRGRKERPPRTMGLIERQRLLLRVLLRYLRALHVSGRVEGVIGLSDPGQTAWLSQVLQLLDRTLPEGVVEVELDWTEEIVALDGRVGAWVWPLEVVVISIGLVLDRKAWRALRAA